MYIAVIVLLAGAYRAAVADTPTSTPPTPSATTPTPAPVPAAPESPTPMTVRQIADACLPSVVTIATDDTSGQPYATGSGFIVDKNVVVTNMHVIQGAGWVTVDFHDGKSIQAAGVLAADPVQDVVIIQVDTHGLPPLKLDTEDDMHVGDLVAALGSPLGLSGSVSSGIIGALRQDDHNNRLYQTTAPVSPGSSGGPLINDQGEVVGITSFLLPDAENMNFAHGVACIPPLLKQRTDKLIPWSTFKEPPTDNKSGQPQAGDGNNKQDAPGDSQGSDDNDDSGSGDDGSDKKGGKSEKAPKKSKPDDDSADDDDNDNDSGSGGKSRTPPASDPKDPTVWVNLNTGIYHMPGTRYYGKTQHGAYMTESEAKKKGYRAANGNG